MWSIIAGGILGVVIVAFVYLKVIRHMLDTAVPAELKRVCTRYHDMIGGLATPDAYVETYMRYRRELDDQLQVLSWNLQQIQHRSRRSDVLGLLLLWFRIRIYDQETLPNTRKIIRQDVRAWVDEAWEEIQQHWREIERCDLLHIARGGHETLYYTLIRNKEIARSIARGIQEHPDMDPNKDTLQTFERIQWFMRSSAEKISAPLDGDTPPPREFLH